MKKIITITAVVLAFGAAPAFALTKNEAIHAAATTVPAMVGLPDANQLQYDPVSVRGHHAKFWAVVFDDAAGKSAEAQVFVVESKSGALHVHVKHVDVEPLPTPDAYPGG